MRYLEYEGNEKLELPFQEEYLLLTEERLKSGDLNCAMGFRLHVFVDEKVLEKTINKIIELNDAFRMQIIYENGKYYQRCAEKYKFKLNVIKTEGTTVEERYNNAYEDAKNKIEKLIPISDEVLWQCYFYKIANDDYLLVFNLHHAISDGYSASIISELLNNYYIAFKNNEKIENADNSNGYMQFIYDELKFSKTEKGGKQLKYWQDELSGYKKIDLSIFKNSSDGSIVNKIINIDMNQMKNIAKREKTSSFVVFMTAYHISISKACGVNDTVIGAASANRTSKAYRKTIGFLSRAIQNRLIIDEDATMSQIISDEFKKLSENIANQSMMLTETEDNSKSIIQFHCTYSPTIIDNSNMTFDGVPYENVQFITRHRIDFLTAMVYEYSDHLMILFVADESIMGSELLKKISSGILEVIETMENNPETRFCDLNLAY